MVGSPEGVAAGCLALRVGGAATFCLRRPMAGPEAPAGSLRGGSPTVPSCSQRATLLCISPELRFKKARSRVKGDKISLSDRLKDATMLAQNERAALPETPAGHSGEAEPVARTPLPMKTSASHHGPGFPTTRWSQVVMAGDSDSRARTALDELCRKYWRPIYAFARRRGISPHDAEDATQSYLADLTARGYLHQADESRGRFRAFLIRDFKFFLSNLAAKEHAAKRGGRAAFVSMDTGAEESRLGLVDSAQLDADAWFDRQWALEVVRLARESVKRLFREQGKEEMFQRLQNGLVASPTAATYAVWEQELGMSQANLRVALHRLRERFRAALEEQVLETVSSPEDLREEMAHLRKALAKAV